jgi:hypothetical protein
LYGDRKLLTILESMSQVASKGDLNPWAANVDNDDDDVEIEESSPLIYEDSRCSTK